MQQELLWILFRGIVCDVLDNAGYDGDPWDFSGDLDMSFDEIKGLPCSEWRGHIEKDMQDYRSEFPGEFIA